MFGIGQYVVKANTGVCRISAITTYQISSDDDDETLYYNLVPESDRRAVLFVPVDSEKSNMRRIMTNEEALDFINGISDIATAWIASDRLREQYYKEAIRSNRPEALVSIIKNLYLRNKEREEHGKKSTAVDDRYSHIAETVLYSELAIALNKDIEEIKEFITERLK